MEERIKSILKELISHNITIDDASLKLSLLTVTNYPQMIISNLRSARKKNGYTLRQVEDLTGISNAYLSQLETGKIKKPSFEVVVKLNKLYHSL